MCAGYVLDDFPCMSEAVMSVKDQLELIKSWKLKPDFIINVKVGVTSGLSHTGGIFSLVLTDMGSHR